MSYNIFQIKISEEIYEHVNGPEGGHSATAKVFPEYHARMKLHLMVQKVLNLKCLSITQKFVKSLNLKIVI